MNMNRSTLHLPQGMYDTLWEHLLGVDSEAEEAAFVFADHVLDNGQVRFDGREHFLVPPKGFASRSPFHFELTDDVRASVIKRAHDLQVSLVELHSHNGSFPARFSPSDLYGFQEFVPHVRWRLKKRPYGAIVVAGSGFDGFVWSDEELTPKRLDAIIVGEETTLTATGLSSLTWRYDDRYDEAE